MSKFGTAIAFFAGAVIGGATAWYIAKERYAQLAEEEIASVKETYAVMDRKKKNAEDAMLRYRGADDTSDDQISAVTAKVAEKGDIAEYAERIKNGDQMIHSGTNAIPKTSDLEEPPKPENSGEHPYVIFPEEFAELDGYTPISLTYFADGVLADEYGVIVDDVEEIVGDALKHFGEYEEDSVYVRNDAKRCDYEILRDEREYKEFQANLPPNVNYS